MTAAKVEHPSKATVPGKIVGSKVCMQFVLNGLKQAKPPLWTFN